MSDTISAEPVAGVAFDSVVPVEKPLQTDLTVMPELLEVDLLVRAAEARTKFNVDGSGMTVAVLDTGLRTTHVDFSGRVRAGRNFTSDNNGSPTDPTDGQGHGTNVAGIICAGGVHTGMAPRAKIVPVKVLGNSGGGSFLAIRDALLWVLANRTSLGISAVCMSLGASDNNTSDADFAGDGIGDAMRKLTDVGVACCVAAGNDYFGHHSGQGMSYPAIFRQTISVGAVYDADEGSFSYGSGATALSTAPDRITPFSQRLHASVGGDCATDIFAPGAPTTSSGIRNDSGESIQHGTSQATPVVAGVVLLIQQFHLRVAGTMPSVADVRKWLLAGAVPIVDGDDENDNVVHTGQTFSRISAFGALTACAKDVARSALVEAGIDRSRV
ncbi:S8 family peptidase [Nocardia salmonicida]|uniref:S8 family peptidase n=1 Tax=Nocardia salmonicida TaxID=53431 RepID=UPI0007A40DED|nr:S8 family serine peptidase [Nocardia salmonicida]